MRKVLLVMIMLFVGALMQAQTISMKGVTIGGVYADDNPFVNEKGTKFIETTVGGLQGEMLIMESDYSDTITGLSFSTTGAYITRDDFDNFKTAVQKNYDIELKQLYDKDTYSDTKGRMHFLLFYVDMRGSGYAEAVNGHVIAFSIMDNELKEKDKKKRLEDDSKDF